MSEQPFPEDWPEPGVLGPRQTFPKGVLLFRQGRGVESLYLVHEGLIKLTRGEATGRSLLIGLRSAGWLLGAAAALLGRRHPVSAETATVGVLSPIAPDAFLRVVRENARAALWMARLHARELYDQNVLAAELGALAPRQRLEHFLARALTTAGQARHGDGVRLQLEVRQYDVAHAIGVAPSHLSRLYAQLESESFVRREKGRIIVPTGSPLFRIAKDLVGDD